MASLTYEYTAPKILLADGPRCEKAGTYVVYHGAVAYKCVEDAAVAAKRGKRAAEEEEEEETSTTDITLETSETEEPTTPEDEDVATTTDEQLTTDEVVTTVEEEATTTEEDVETTAAPESPTDAPVPAVKSEQYEISGEVIVETPQPIFESQWNTLAEQIQQKLERRRVIFTADIFVEML
ncbi:unnamed protein product [Strongylus vulgaris]|uniref:Uncharacterized protein n=1 Tax=Strongylus vulgaris TaxID=40348 RepID=A0A3P7L1V5_STRVU|nr:unnamed protein product [Strongylus vulgaris]